jgi:DNA-binding TFAR19-related protein (PDSD5 family)
MSEDEERDLERIRARKSAEMQKSEQSESRVRAALRMVLDEGAYERLMNVRISSPDLYAKAVQACSALYGRLGRKLTDRELLSILVRIKGPEQKETRISFERK